ncbi:hypothetical protein FB45DRAFT_869380 [Roridomyces roridus]|uniref:Uncharacterized protein n=1 Tax=Roridomyces roridus TaxID=1738132 RepID=A0AAD7FHB9_9AGAR|nr:hypothetical protein FB45DRAFT_869380 [Roridomyces roridus]
MPLVRRRHAGTLNFAARGSGVWLPVDMEPAGTIHDHIHPASPVLSELYELRAMERGDVSDQSPDGDSVCWTLSLGSEEADSVDNHNRNQTTIQLRHRTYRKSASVQRASARVRVTRAGRRVYPPRVRVRVAELDTRDPRTVPISATNPRVTRTRTRGYGYTATAGTETSNRAGAMNSAGARLAEAREARALRVQGIIVSTMWCRDELSLHVEHKNNGYLVGRFKAMNNPGTRGWVGAWEMDAQGNSCTCCHRKRPDAPNRHWNEPERLIRISTLIFIRVNEIKVPTQGNAGRWYGAVQERKSSCRTNWNGDNILQTPGDKAREKESAVQDLGPVLCRRNPGDKGGSKSGWHQFSSGLRSLTE